MGDLGLCWLQRGPSSHSVIRTVMRNVYNAREQRECGGVGGGLGLSLQTGGAGELEAEEAASTSALGKEEAWSGLGGGPRAWDVIGSRSAETRLVYLCSWPWPSGLEIGKSWKDFRQGSDTLSYVTESHSERAVERSRWKRGNRGASEEPIAIVQARGSELRQRQRESSR